MTTTTIDPTDSATPILVPTARVAEQLSCHPRTVNRMAQRGIIPQPIVLGNMRRWDLRRVLAAMQTRTPAA